MKSWMILAALVAATAVANAQTPSPSPASQASGAQATPAGNADTGKKLFVSFGCYQCHGYEAQGSSATGPRLGPKPIAWAAFTRYVRRPTNQMPPFTAKVVSDADLANIYAFLQARPTPMPVADIPLLTGK